MKEYTNIKSQQNKKHYKRQNKFMYKTPTIHNSKEYKELRKTFQGINATTKGSIEKSKRRHNSKQLAINKHK